MRENEAMTDKLTPEDVELVEASQIVVGDLLVFFTRPGVSVTRPPTAGQLSWLYRKNASPGRLFVVDEIRTVRPGILEFGREDNPNRCTMVQHMKLWRKKT
jgi:hypothetical protein